MFTKEEVQRDTKRLKELIAELKSKYGEAMSVTCVLAIGVGEPDEDGDYGSVARTVALKRTESNVDRESIMPLFDDPHTCVAITAGIGTILTRNAKMTELHNKFKESFGDIFKGML